MLQPAHALGRLSLVLALCSAVAHAQICKQVSEEAKVDPGVGIMRALFGFDLAIDGDTAVVGAPREGSGRVYVYERDEGGPGAWGRTAKFSGTGGATIFGDSVDLCGDTLVVGAADNFPSRGASLYERDEGGPGAWGLVATLGSSPIESVAVEDDTVVLGSPFEDRAFVYQRDEGGPNAWGLVVTINGPDTSFSDEFGGSVAISGDTIVVGARLADSGKGLNVGAAYIFERDLFGANAWGQRAKLILGGGKRLDYFGESVAVEGDTLCVGAPSADANGLDDTGIVRVFRRDFEQNWTLATSLFAADAKSRDRFGSAVEISGDLILVGAPGDDNEGGNDAGAAYLFEREQGTLTWLETNKLTSSDATTIFDQYGNAVAIDGETIGVGVRGDDDPGLMNTGSAFFYGVSSFLATVTTRNGGSNPTSFVASTAVLGGTLRGTCNLATTGHATAFFFAFDAPTSLTLGGGQTLLCTEGVRVGELLSGSGVGPSPGPFATFDLPVPIDPSLCGFQMCIQAMHLSGVTPFALSNAQDLVIGAS